MSGIAVVATVGVFLLSPFLKRFIPRIKLLAFLAPPHHPPPSLFTLRARRSSLRFRKVSCAVQYCVYINTLKVASSPSYLTEHIGL